MPRVCYVTPLCEALCPEAVVSTAAKKKNFAQFRRLACEANSDLIYQAGCPSCCHCKNCKTRVREYDDGVGELGNELNAFVGTDEGGGLGMIVNCADNFSAQDDISSQSELQVNEYIFDTEESYWRTIFSPIRNDKTRVVQIERGSVFYS